MMLVFCGSTGFACLRCCYFCELWSFAVVELMPVSGLLSLLVLVASRYHYVSCLLALEVVLVAWYCSLLRLVVIVGGSVGVALGLLALCMGAVEAAVGLAIVFLGQSVRGSLDLLSNVLLCSLSLSLLEIKDRKKGI